VAHSFASPGSYTLHLLVEDEAGTSVNLSYNLTVTSAPASSASPAEVALGSFVGVVVGLVIGAVVIYGIGRRGRTPPPTPPKAFEPPAGTESAPAEAAHPPTEPPWTEG
jgi:PKD repeat protein